MNEHIAVILFVLGEDRLVLIVIHYDPSEGGRFRGRRRRCGRGGGSRPGRGRTGLQVALLDGLGSRLKALVGRKTNRLTQRSQDLLAVEFAALETA